MKITRRSFEIFGIILLLVGLFLGCTENSQGNAISPTAIYTPQKTNDISIEPSIPIIPTNQNKTIGQPAMLDSVISETPY